MFSTIKNEEVRWILKKGGCSSKQRGRKQARDFCYDCENFAGIAKISQS